MLSAAVGCHQKIIAIAQRSRSFNLAAVFVCFAVILQISNKKREEEGKKE